MEVEFQAYEDLRRRICFSNQGNVLPHPPSQFCSLSWSDQEHHGLSPRNWLHSSWEYLFRLDLENMVSFECSPTQIAARFSVQQCQFGSRSLPFSLILLP